MHATQKLLIKSFSTGVTVGVLLLPLPGTVYGYFSDESNLTDKGSFSTGEIKATLDANTPNQHVSTNASSSTFTLTTNDTSTLDTQSQLTFSPQSCSIDFHNAIQLEVTTDKNTSAGTFEGVVINEAEVSDSYQLNVEISSDFIPAQSESCTILATLETWQTEFPDATHGFSDVDTTIITLTMSEPVVPQETTPAAETAPDAIDTIADENSSISFIRQSMFRQRLFV